MARGTRHHSLYPRERKSCSKNQLVWDREVHLRSGNKQLSVSGRKATNLPWGEPAQPKPYLPGDAKTVSGVLAQIAVHQRTVSANCDPCPRTGATTGARACGSSGLCCSTTPAPESRSTLCGVEELDRTAEGPLAENEACSRTVLSRGYSPELETTGSLPKIEISRISHGSDMR
jgi:hypothetical protein